MDGGERVPLPYRRISNTIYESFPVRELELKSPLLACGLDLVTRFEREESGKEIVTVTWLGK